MTYGTSFIDENFQFKEDQRPETADQTIMPDETLLATPSSPSLLNDQTGQKLMSTPKSKYWCRCVYISITNNMFN